MTHVHDAKYTCFILIRYRWQHNCINTTGEILCQSCTIQLVIIILFVNPLECKGNYSATLNNMKLVHWPLMDGVMYTVLSSLAACGCLGVAAAGVFVCHA